jgi:REP element-mobilizing transposase RayT
VSHLRRPVLKARHPVHVTMRLRAGLPSLRHKPLARLVLASFHAAKERLDTRLVHYSVQSNHVHLLVEADGHRALSRAMQGLATRLAKRLNGLLKHRGPVFADRYHARALKTPLEVRRALVYVLHNHRRHTVAPGRRSGLDPLSTAPYFDGFAPGIVRPPPTAPPEEPPAARARTWLLRVGWRRHGLLGALDVPA